MRVRSFGCRVIGVEPRAGTDSWGATALHWAAREGHLEVIVLLIARGAAVNRRSEPGESPLCQAQLYNRVNKQKTLRVLRRHGARF